MIFSLFGTKIYVSYFFVAVFTVMVFCDKTGLIIPLSIAVFSHETAHLLGLFFYKSAPKEIKLSLGGMLIVKPENLNIKQEIFVLICGPLSNLILFFVFLILYNCTRIEIFLKNAAVELIVSIYNLLPARGLDGGTLLYNFLISTISPFFANLICLFVSLFVAAFFLVFGFFSFLNDMQNISIIIFSIYLLIFTFLKN